MVPIDRAFSDRRSGKERRKRLTLHKIRYRGKERRRFGERRLRLERRNGWVRVSRWASASLSDLKIAKFLKP